MPMFTRNKDKKEETEEATELEAAVDVADEDEAPEAAEAVATEAAAEEVASGESDAEADAAEADADAGDESADDAEADDDEDDEYEDDDDNSGGSNVDLDLMDIFESEQQETTSTASIYAEFLEALTMEEVLDQADMLLDEIRTKLQR